MLRFATKHVGVGEHDAFSWKAGIRSLHEGGFRKGFANARIDRNVEVLWRCARERALYQRELPQTDQPCTGLPRLARIRHRCFPGDAQGVLLVKRFQALQLRLQPLLERAQWRCVTPDSHLFHAARKQRTADYKRKRKCAEQGER